MLPLLQVKNLSISFEHSLAVSNVNFVLGKGKILAVVGESGSGKSLTALSIPGLLPGNATMQGEIIFNDRDGNPVSLTKLPEKEMIKLRGSAFSMIFQEPMTSLNPVHTCGDQVMEAILQHHNISKKQARERAIELFKEVELPEPELMLKRYPHQVSGGQKQRVMIAMAMSCNPALLIADEPTTALDVRVQKSIIELIKRIQQKTGMSVLFITHDLGLVAEIADDILVMRKGEIVEQGKATRVLHQPEHWYTKALLSCRPTPEKKGSKLKTGADFEETREQNTNEKIHKNEVLTQKTTLEVRDLTVSFPKGKKNIFSGKRERMIAVNEVSFEVRENEIVGLVGESGCGKTTLGKTIMQLIQPDSGEVLLNGIDLNKLSTKKLRQSRKGFQVVFQDPFGSLNPRINIGNAVQEPLEIHQPGLSAAGRKEKVKELLRQVKLPPESIHKYPHEFSGGQRQRICIARALAVNPSFLVFDESVSALDVSVQAQILNLINELKQELNFSALFISHDLSVVYYLCDRIVVMNKGSIVESGIANEIFFHSKNEYTRALIEAIPGTTAL